MVAAGNKVYGVIYLKDTVKAGLKERFDKIRKMGIKTIMCTGDNPSYSRNYCKRGWNR